MLEATDEQRSLDRETLYPHIKFRDPTLRFVHFASLRFSLSVVLHSRLFFCHMPNPVVLTKSVPCFIGI